MSKGRNTLRLRRLNVLLWSAIDDTYAQQLYAHIIGRIRRDKKWNIVYKRALTHAPEADIRWRSIDGVLAGLNDRDIARRFKARKKPLINTGDDMDDLGIPGVHVDNHAVGRMAAEYLLRRGVRNVACVGINPSFALSFISCW